MGCTTILVGRGATNDGSTIVARNEDTGNGTFLAKKMVVVNPEDQPRTYTGVTNHLTIELPANPLRYTCVPNADPSAGVWGEAGINAANVCMSATETITTNARVLGADPLVCYEPPQGTEGSPGYRPEKPGGVGEENFVTIILPYITSAKDGVRRMGELLETYGTYESNGVAFGDEQEVWYIETIGGHHWIARRVPDDCYVAQPNRQGIDYFDLNDALGEQKDFMCSKDLPKWMADNQLNMQLAADAEQDTIDGTPAVFNPRYAFSSFLKLDMMYNNPRAWYIEKMFNPTSEDFRGDDPRYLPESFDIPWCRKPENRLSVLDVKAMLATTYDGTEFDCYRWKGEPKTWNKFRDIGINRTGELSILNIRPGAPKAVRAVQWTAFGSGPFNTAVAVFTNVSKVPAYLDTGLTVSTDSFYWQNRIVAGLADPEFYANMENIMTYRQSTLARGYEALHQVDSWAHEQEEKGRDFSDMDDAGIIRHLEEVNQATADFVQEQNNALLGTVLFNRSLSMKNAYGFSDN